MNSLLEKKTIGSVLMLLHVMAVLGTFSGCLTTQDLHPDIPTIHGYEGGVYLGGAAAEYEFNISDISPEDRIRAVELKSKPVFRHMDYEKISKLTKTELSLAQQALETWVLKEGDVFTIYLSEVDSAVVIVKAVIMDSSGAFEYVAWRAPN